MQLRAKFQSKRAYDVIINRCRNSTTTVTTLKIEGNASTETREREVDAYVTHLPLEHLQGFESLKI